MYNAIMKHNKVDPWLLPGSLWDIRGRRACHKVWLRDRPFSEPNGHGTRAESRRRTAKQTTVQKVSRALAGGNGITDLRVENEIKLVNSSRFQPVIGKEIAVDKKDVALFKIRKLRQHGIFLKMVFAPVGFATPVYYFGQPFAVFPGQVDGMLRDVESNDIIAKQESELRGIMAKATTRYEGTSLFERMGSTGPG